MAIHASYIFNNSGKETRIIAESDNAPTSACEKIKEALINYGSQDFDPTGIAEVFADINSYSGCKIQTFNDNSNTDFTYIIEAIPPRGNKKANINITVLKSEKEIFNGSMKKFFVKVEKLENTYLNF